MPPQKCQIVYFHLATLEFIDKTRKYVSLPFVSANKIIARSHKSDDILGAATPLYKVRYGHALSIVGVFHPGR